jgi:ubiquinone/menaquinone biosynthesis C-methylase UbiE
MGIGQERLSVGLSDISTPSDVTLVPGDTVTLEKESLDLISVGAVIGYSKDQSKTIKALLDLIKPGGILINLEMNERLMGRWTSYRYEYDVMPLKEMEAIMVGEGCRVSMQPLSLKYFPASATRIGILAVKK